MEKPPPPVAPTLARVLPVHGIGLSFFHVVVIVLSLVMTLSAWQFSKYQIETRTGARFEAERDRVIGLIETRLHKYEDLLWSSASAVESHDGAITREQWKIFGRNLRIEDKYSGISALGVVHHVSRADLPAFTAERRRERPDLTVRPPHDEPVHLVLTYITPEEGSAKAIGFDLANEANRLDALLASRDSGAARITGPIEVRRDSGPVPGFLFAVPFYDGVVPATVEARRDGIQGFIAASFATRKLMEGLLNRDLRELRFSIADGDETIYDEHSADDPTRDPNPMFRETVSLDLYGRTWTLDMRSNLVFREANTFAQPTFVLIGGLLIEALIVALLLLMARANGRAVAYADEVTAQLKKKTGKLAEANRALSGKNVELEQFAYVTSHDLKTPIRGIGGLTEMVQEDLEDYLSLPDANPDVAANLQRIRDRVHRMNELTGGIMEFSRIGRPHDSEDPVELEGIVDALRSDFALSETQLIVSDPGYALTADTFSFRRVIENLVGNAIKYHDDTGNMVVSVSGTVEGSRMTVTVSDNGPGIDEDYHDRIFEIFQTLRSGDAPESTGIGLAIVKKAVENHGGRIEVASAPGKGATFAFDWPLTTEADASTETSRAA